MSALDWLLLGAVVVCAALAWRRARKSGNCCGDCARCGKACKK